MRMDCLAASYNWPPNGPPRFGVGLARQSGADTQPLGGPHRRRNENDAADRAYVVRTTDNNTTSVRGLHTPSGGAEIPALLLVPIHALRLAYPIANRFWIVAPSPWKARSTWGGRIIDVAQADWPFFAVRSRVCRRRGASLKR